MKSSWQRPLVWFDYRESFPRVMVWLVTGAAVLFLGNLVKIGANDGLTLRLLAAGIVLIGGWFAYWRLQRRVRADKASLTLATALALFWLIAVAQFIGSLRAGIGR